MKRISILDSLRGVAAMVVVIHHVFSHLNKAFAGLPGWCWQALHFISELNVAAVIFFFFLSGCSIFLAIEHQVPVTKNLLAQYLFKRAKRILPLYWIALLLSWSVGSLLHQTDTLPYRFSTLLGNGLFMQCSPAYKGNWFVPYGNNGPLWSLPFEVTYYLILPVWLWMALRFSGKAFFSVRQQVVYLFISFCLSLAAIVLNQYIFIPWIAYAGLWYSWYSGFYLAMLYRQKQHLQKLAIAAPVVFGAILVTFNYLKPSATLTKLLTGNLLFVFVYSLLIVKSYRPVWIEKIQQPVNWLFYKIGTGSYALYLLHFPVLLWLEDHTVTQLWLIIVCMALVTIGCILLETRLVATMRKWTLR